MRTTTSVTISLPPALLKQAERIAKRENRTISELFREALRRYEQQEKQVQPSPAALNDLGMVLRLIQQDAKRAGLDKMTKREINAEVAAARKDMRAKARKSSN